MKLSAPVTVKAGAKGAYVFAKADGEADSFLTAAVAEARTVVPAKAGAEAGVVMRMSREGGYLFGIRGDGTLFIRAVGPAFGEKAPYVEKKTALKGEVVLKATACGSMLSLSAGRERLVLRDAICPVGRCGAYAMGADAAFKEFKVSNPMLKYLVIKGTSDVFKAGGICTEIHFILLLFLCFSYIILYVL